MEEKPVCVKVSITVEDTYALQEKSMKFRRIWFSIIMLITTLVLAVKDLDFTSIGSIIISIFPIFVMLIVIFFFVPRTLKRTQREQNENNKLTQIEPTYILTPDGIEQVTEMSTSKYKWSDLYAFRETKDYFCFFIASNQYFWIPKKKFGSDEIDLLQQYFKNLPLYKKKNIVLLMLKFM